MGGDMKPAHDAEPLAAAVALTSSLPTCKEYAIRRSRGQAWRVTFERRSVTYDRTFPDAVHGGAECALIAARAWRDEQLAQATGWQKREVSNKRRPNNTSGVPGVYLREMQRLRKDGIARYTLWIALSPEGVRPFRSRSFSVERYGNERAFALAVQARQQFLNDYPELEEPALQCVPAEFRGGSEATGQASPASD